MRTVQGVLEHTLTTILAMGAGVTLVVAGRTDAGVHARGQVAHLDIPPDVWQRTGSTLRGRLNRMLPDDIRVQAVTEAAVGFDARFSALWRRYSYRICYDVTYADPLRRLDTLWHPRPLDAERMNEAAIACLGEHDFSAFCRRRAGASTIRELLRFDWQNAGPGLLAGTIIADAFCHNMVRALTGASLAIGDGRRPVRWLADVLAARVRDPAVTVAPAHPLCLEQVSYPPDEQLADRVAATRRIRGPVAPGQ